MKFFEFIGFVVIIFPIISFRYVCCVGKRWCFITQNKKKIYRATCNVWTWYLNCCSSVLTNNGLFLFHSLHFVHSFVVLCTFPFVTLGSNEINFFLWVHANVNLVPRIICIHTVELSFNYRMRLILFHGLIQNRA